MSISLQFERLITFREAAAYLPAGCTPRPSTWWRWWHNGLNGVRLETLVVGGRRFTSAEAVGRFAEALTQQADRPQTSERTQSPAKP
jgi:hypothetical protein